MLGTLFKVLVMTLVVVAITAVVGLGIMAGVAGTHDVKRVAVPKNCSLSAIAGTSDYIDAFRGPMEYASYRTIEEVSQNATIKGDMEIHRNKYEVVYAGSAPGITYQVAYVLDREAFPPTIAMVTAVKFAGKKGRYYWKVMRPIHRCLAPYMVDRLKTRAPN